MNPFRFFILALLLVSASLSAAPIPLTNPAFESGTERLIGGFDISGKDVPGWKNAGTAFTNSGVELALQPGSAGGYVNTSGYVAFLKGSDGGAYQVTSHTIAAGQVYRLVWKAGSILGSAGSVTPQVRLFSTTNNGTTRNTLAFSTIVLNASNKVFETYVLEYTAKAAEAGAKLGIEFDNTATNSNIIGFDDFELEVDPVSPAPATGLPVLAWDDGATDDGTAVFNGSTAIEREYHFLVTTQASVPGAWRTVLRVASGNADIYASTSVWPTTAGGIYNSNRATGDDGFVVSNNSYVPGLTWRVTVRAQAGTDFSLVCGNVFVTDLPGPAFTDSNSNGKYDPGEPITPVASGPTVVKPEGVRIFKTAVPAGLSAWSLWLNGDNDRRIYVRKNLAAVPAINDVNNPGSLLVVPSQLDTAAGGTYYIGIPGEPGDTFNLDSRAQEVQDMEFGSTAPAANVTGPPYRVFKVAVPADQIGWDISSVANSGDPNLSVRKDVVGSELTNSAISAAPGATTDAVTLVPDFLTQGTWYITTYGRGDYNFTLRNGNPEITTLAFNDLKTNDQLNRAGSRMYRITDVPSQIGALGWELMLRDQVPGASLLLRRNKMPGTWQSGKVGSLTATTYADYSDANGWLQRPDHTADIWYVTVHTPQAAAGGFQLESRAITPDNRSFEPFAVNGNALPPGKWKYLKVEVPDLGALLGWDLGLTNVSGGVAQMAVRRDALPISTSVSFSPASTPAMPWPSGNTLAGPQPDWTLRADPTDFSNTQQGPRKRLRIPTGNPLMPGTYYIGIYNAGVTPMTFDLFSQRIGAGEAVEVPELAYSGGSFSFTGLAPREGIFRKITIPANTRSWELGLAATLGEVNLIVRRGYIPVSEIGTNTQGAVGNSFQVRKLGSERYVILPANNQDYIAEGDYYVAVVAEGQNPPSTAIIGTGTCSGTLTSYGPLAITSLGASSASPITRAVSLEAGQMKPYSFTVPAGATSLEVRLDNRVGNPAINLVAGSRIPASGSYGSEGGQTGASTNSSAITMVAPAAGTYTVLVRCAPIIGSAEPYVASSGNLVVTAKTAAALSFNGGVTSVTNQAANAWNFYQVTVPATAGIMGWDLMVRNVTGNGTPKIVVRRDLVPTFLGTTSSWNDPDAATSWPSGNSLMAPLLDWTQRPYDVSGGVYTRSRRLVMAMGAPLEPGTYYVGILNDGTAACSYTLESRGIGASQSIAVEALAFPSGSNVNITNLAPRQVNYRKVTIPAQTRSWEVLASEVTGEMSMFVRYGKIPTITGGYQCVKTGSERFVMMPADGQDYLAEGDYYVAVVSEGFNPPDSQTVGASTIGMFLRSNGELAVGDLGEVSTSPVSQPVTLQAGQISAYQFTIPQGLTNLSLRLDNVTGGAQIHLNRGTRLPRPDLFSNTNSGYGGGQTTAVSHGNTVSLNNPVAGTYTLDIRGTAYTTAASGTLVITPSMPLPPEPLVLDGGSVVVSGQAQIPRYFQVVVPENAALLGWDVRLKNVTGTGIPRIRIRRDQVPDDASFTSSFTNSSSSSPSWPTGEQWDGGTSLVMGMGRPLQAGTYYISVHNTSSGQTTSYTLQSRGIGQGFAIPVVEFGTQATISNQAPGESAYFSINIPSGTPSAEFTLDPSVGDMRFAVRRGYLPDSNVYGSSQSSGTQRQWDDQQKSASRTGAERLTLLPAFGQSFLLPGTYYLAANTESSVSGTAVLTNHGPLAIESLGAITDTAGASRPVALAPGQLKAFTFTLPADVPALEIQLAAAGGSPSMHVFPSGLIPVPTEASYGIDGGQVGAQISSQGIIDWKTPPAGTYTVLTRSTDTATATFSVRQRRPIPLNFSPTQNASGGTNTDTRSLESGQTVTYGFPAAAGVDGGSALGWVIRTNVTAGSAPTITLNGTNIPASRAVVAPPLFNPAVAQSLDVTATLAGTYTITSEPAVLRLAPWAMPQEPGQTFGDSGELLGGDKGTDLPLQDWHFYAVDVPAGNQGLLRTELQAISGQPELYLREGAIPTRSHGAPGFLNFQVYSRVLNDTGSQYGNWVPLDGRVSEQLTPGRYYLGVRAGGGSNVRYRLIVSTGAVTPLALDGGSVTGQALARNDWRYYRFTVPYDAPTDWKLNFSEQSGDVSLFIRDTVPPGNTSTAFNSASWANDLKNQGSYAAAIPPGEVSLPMPPLRPGHTYYAGIRANTDAVFSLGSTIGASTSGLPPVVDFYTGVLNVEVPATSSLLYRITAPADAARIKWTSSHASSVQLRLEQGTFPATTGNQHSASTGADSSLSRLLSGWPWLPAKDYYLRIVNNGASVAAVSLTMKGRTPATDDEDNDGLADAWERERYVNSTVNTGLSDGDFDGVPDLLEFAFDLPKASQNPVVQTGASTPGLPLVTTVGPTNSPKVRIEYLRRRTAPIQYTVEFSGSLNDGGSDGWAAPSVSPVVTPIDGTWERVVVEEPAAAGSTRRFGRVRVTASPD